MILLVFLAAWRFDLLFDESFSTSSWKKRVEYQQPLVYIGAGKTMGTERSHIGTVSERIMEVVSSRGDVVAVYLFGSLLNGPHTSESDVDVAILFSGELAKMEQLALQQKLSDRLGVEVDLVDLARAPVVLRMQVLRKGRKILDRNPRITTAFIVRTLFEYDDLKRIIKPIEDNILRGRIYG
jgi:hypothetical protein